MYSRSVLRSISHYQVNLIIKILIISDFLIWSSYQLFTPFFAIFVTDKIHNGSIEAIGIASAIYLLSKSLFEIPVGVYIDRSKSEVDDLFVSILGTVLTAIAYFAYIFIDSIAQLYFLQAVLGLGAAIAFPGWYSIFTRHVDKGKEAFEWSLYDVLLGVGMAATAALGGFLADGYGFDVLFLMVGLFTLAGAILLFIIKDKIYKR
ncbi:MFS transporter [Candidatus Parcubacteria bacterium]|nr:MAG: MFS transporter [Candidatus Parcubacteria bacterium]